MIEAYNLPQPLIDEINELVSTRPKAHLHYFGNGLGWPQWVLEGVTPIEFGSALSHLREAGADTTKIEAKIAAYFADPKRQAEKLDALEDKKHAIENDILAFKKKWAASCPLKRGDITKVGRTGTPFVGQQANILSVGVRHNGVSWAWRICGSVLKKDGTSSRRGRCVMWDASIEGLSR